MPLSETQGEFLDRSYVQFPSWDKVGKCVEYTNSTRTKEVRTWKWEEFKKHLDTLEPEKCKPKVIVVSPAKAKSNPIEIEEVDAYTGDIYKKVWIDSVSGKMINEITLKEEQRKS